MTTATYRLHPGARLLLYVLWELADDESTVCVPSAELMRRTGWGNRMSLRKRAHELANAGLLTIEPTERPDGGQGPNRYRLNGVDDR